MFLLFILKPNSDRIMDFYGNNTITKTYFQHIFKILKIVEGVETDYSLSFMLVKLKEKLTQLLGNKIFDNLVCLKYFL